VVAKVVEVSDDFRPQDVEIFRPYSDEIPWELLANADADYIRVAKFADEAIGAYVIEPESPTCYVLKNLAVDAAWRRRGLGRWLLGHAIGISESKGAREILARSVPRGARGLFERTGFQPEGEDLRLVLLPE
jgi:GNAT superfamily N-acetyltransferase